jgi:hypothetical protein
MAETLIKETNGRDLLQQMVAARQLSDTDARHLEKQRAAGVARFESEEDVLRWLASEYGLDYTGLDDVEPGSSAR